MCCLGPGSKGIWHCILQLLEFAVDVDVGVALAGHDMHVLVCHMRVLARHMHVYMEGEAVGVEMAFLDMGGV